MHFTEMTDTELADYSDWCAQQDADAEYQRKADEAYPGYTDDYVDLDLLFGGDR